MAGITNLTIEKGSSFDVTITLNEIDGTPIDLTEYTAAGKMCSSYYNNGMTYDIDCTILSPATEGNIKLHKNHADTELLVPGRYYYNIDITDTANDIIRRVLEGIMIVTPSSFVFEGATGVVGSTGAYDGINFYSGSTSFLRLH
jgi:hypothetical protein